MKNYGTNKNGNKGRNTAGASTTQKLALNKIRNELGKIIAARNSMQDRQRAEWRIVKRYETSRSRELARIDDKIKSLTHKANQLVSKVCQYKCYHAAMNLAYSYIKNEEARTEKIIDKWERTIRRVNNGTTSLIDADGITHCDTTHVRAYVEQKRHQLSKLKGWEKHVSHYLAA